MSHQTSPPDYNNFTIRNIAQYASISVQSRSLDPVQWCNEMWAYVSNLEWGKWVYIFFSYLVILFGVVTGPYIILCSATKSLLGSSFIFEREADLEFTLEKDVIFWILIYIGVQAYKLLTDMQKLIFGDESSILNQLKEGIIGIIQAWKA